MFGQEPVTALHHSPVAAAVGDEPDPRLGVPIDDGTRHSLASSFILACQAIHVVHVVVWSFGILSVFIVPAATREISSLGMAIAGQSPVRDAVAIRIAVTSKFLYPLQVLARKHFAT